MKKIKMIFATALLILVSVTVKAQEKKADFFVGKWECLTVGTPGGDGKSVIILKRNEEGKLIGSLSSIANTGGDSPFSRVDEKEKSVTVYFKANGYDVYIYLEKVDDNHLSGSTMDMFDTTATRVQG